MNPDFEPLSIVYHPHYDIPVPKIHSFVGTKFSDLFNNLQKNYSSRLNILTPSSANLENLKQSHNIDYINKVQHDELTREYLRLINLPWSKRLRKRSFLEAEGTLLTAKQALKTGLACHVGGGTHHAHFDHGFGFCVFNDLAYTAINLLNQKLVKKVLILDLDVHQGDGTASIFANADSVFTFSIHCESNFPLKKMVSNLDVPLKKGTNDKEYLNILQQSLEKLHQVPSDIIFFQAGVDVLESDGLGHLSLTRDGLIERNEMVFDFAKKRLSPLVVFMGGGYSKPIEHTVHSFVDLFEQCSLYPKQ